jgi:hypothetical protein
VEHSLRIVKRRERNNEPQSLPPSGRKPSHQRPDGRRGDLFTVWVSPPGRLRPAYGPGGPCSSALTHTNGVDGSLVRSGRRAPTLALVAPLPAPAPLLGSSIVVALVRCSRLSVVVYAPSSWCTLLNVDGRSGASSGTGSDGWRSQLQRLPSAAPTVAPLLVQCGSHLPTASAAPGF